MKMTTDITTSIINRLQEEVPYAYWQTFNNGNKITGWMFIAQCPHQLRIMLWKKSCTDGIRLSCMVWTKDDSYKGSKVVEVNPDAPELAVEEAIDSFVSNNR